MSPKTEEPVRRLPVWLARLANLLIHWTDRYCVAGCGYPVTTQWYTEIERIDGVIVAYALCGVGNVCHQRVTASLMGDQFKTGYAEMRPSIIEAITVNPDINHFFLARSR